MSLAYDTDFYAWTQEQADALARRSANELDWDNLREELTLLGSEVELGLTSALEQVIHHWLKWLYQERRRSRSWVLSIQEHRRRVQKRLVLSPSLRPILPDIFLEAYQTARLTAARETDSPLESFPETPPFDLEFVMEAPIAWEAPAPQRRSRTRKTKG